MDRTPPHPHDGSYFRQAAVGLMMIGLLLVALVAYLQQQAAAQQDMVSARAQSSALQHLGASVAGAAELNFHTRGAYARWLELDRAADLAAPHDAARLHAAQEVVAGLSPLLSTPYFAPSTDAAPDTVRFAVDTYVEEATVRAERSADGAAARQAWAQKANVYALGLMLLAVALFVSGMSILVVRRVRWLFLGSGMLMTGFAAYWALGTFLAPVDSLAPEAINAYAQGMGLSARANYAEARLAFDKAIALEPGYGNAYIGRAAAEQRLGNLARAVADLEAAQLVGRDDAYTAWQLGWNHYLLGDFERAVEAYEHALALAPQLAGARFALGLARLADGQVGAARAEIDQAITDTAVLAEQARMNQSQPLASFWVQMADAAMGFDDLVDRLAQVERPWTSAPPVGAIAEPAAVRAAALELVSDIKSASVALEFGGQRAVGGEGTEVTPFEFGRRRVDEAGNLAGAVEPTDTFSAMTDEVVVNFGYQGAHDGMREVWKVFVDGVEDPSWRIEDKWTLGSNGRAAKVLGYAYRDIPALAPGEYRVELYLDNRLMQSGQFVVNPD